MRNPNTNKLNVTVPARVSLGVWATCRTLAGAAEFTEGFLAARCMR